MKSYRMNKGAKIINDDRTFFCSELVAKAFKILQIMEEDGRASSQFYPSHFTSTGDQALNLSAGTTIDPELEIIQDDYYPTELPMEAQYEHFRLEKETLND